MFKMRTSVKQVVDNTADLLKGIRLLEKNQVLVGVPAEKTEREDTGPVTNALIGYIAENGSPTMNIPARPWLASGVKENAKPISEQLRRTGEAALDARPDGVVKGFIATGLVAVSALKNKINSNIPPPLAKSTLAARRRRGHNSTRTLVETGQFRNAVSFVVRQK